MPMCPTPHLWLRRVALGGVATLMVALTGCATQRAVVYVSNADSKDISVLRLDAAKGTLEPVQTVPVGGTVMPLAVSADAGLLYAALRSEPFTVATFRIDPASGLLAPVATSPLPDSMANIALDRSGRHLLAASYGGHRISVSPITASGAPAAAALVLATGKNAHAIQADPSNRHVLVTNLGDDQVLQYRFDAATGGLVPNPAAPVWRASAGSGPRHFVFHPNGRQVYLLGELDAGVDLLDYDAAGGTLKAVARWSTLPPGFVGKPWAADLHISPNGRFLYTSERTSSTLAAWRIDPADGRLTLVGHVATEKQPRGFAIDPTGRWLLAVGQLSNSLTVYAIDAQTGQLTARQSYAMGKNPNWVEIVRLR